MKRTLITGQAIANQPESADDPNTAMNWDNTIKAAKETMKVSTPDRYPLF